MTGRFLWVATKNILNAIGEAVVVRVIVEPAIKVGKIGEPIGKTQVLLLLR